MNEKNKEGRFFFFPKESRRKPKWYSSDRQNRSAPVLNIAEYWVQTQDKGATLS